MRFIHCSDLHLGRALRERSLLEDQAAMLDRLARSAQDPAVSALVISGDVYDRGVPAQDALRLLDGFLNRVKAERPELAVIIIPGNHDAAGRLGFGAGLLAGAGVHIRSKAIDCLEPIVVPGGGRERLLFWTLPFLTPGCLPRDFGAAAAERKPERVGPQSGEFDFEASASVAEADLGEAPRSQQELMQLAIAAISRRLDPEDVNVLVAHCFARGGSPSESERAFLGEAEQVDASLFDCFDYAALGHLHRPQSAGLRARYCGSPLAYAFDEAGQERGFLLVEARKGGSRVEFQSIAPLHALRRVTGPFARIRDEAIRDPARQDYIEAALSDPEPVLNPVEALKAVYPNLLSVRQLAFEPSGAREEEAIPLRERDDAASVLADFAAFHREVLGADADPASLELVERLIMEADRAPDQA